MAAVIQLVCGGGETTGVDVATGGVFVSLPCSPDGSDIVSVDGGAVVPVGGFNLDNLCFLVGNKKVSFACDGLVTTVDIPDGDAATVTTSCCIIGDECVPGVPLTGDDCLPGSVLVGE